MVKSVRVGVTVLVAVTNVRRRNPSCFFFFGFIGAAGFSYFYSARAGHEQDT